MIDLRSDTVTRPTAAMRKAMAEAEVGDVVFDDDPTVNRLEAVIAERLGFETAMFVPSGTMSNQIGVGVHLAPGDAVLMPAFAHVARWEGGGIAASFGAVMVHIAGGPDDDGLPGVAAFERHLYGPHPKAPRPVLMALENTHNWAGGRAYPAARIGEHLAWARGHGLARHLDGARLMNAAAATGNTAAELAAGFDTVSVCFSKGLGAPTGSCLLMPRALREKANRIRHRLGGGWRQAGLLAAAALHALDHHVDRLGEDHVRARALAELLVRHEIGTPLHPVETNIVQFEVHPRFGTSEGLVAKSRAAGVAFFPTGPKTARIVTHLEVDDEAVARVDAAWKSL